MKPGRPLPYAFRVVQSMECRSAGPPALNGWRFSSTCFIAGTCTTPRMQGLVPAVVQTKDEIKATREGMLEELSTYPVYSDKLPTAIYEAPNAGIGGGLHGRLARLQPPGGHGL